jgi:hypothetical protein
MRDNDLIRLFLPIINTGLVVAGFTDVVVKQSNQPTQQGINSGPTVYFFKVGDKRYGYLRRDDEWDENDNLMVHTEMQYYETTFQISALVMQNPKTPYQYTASDLINQAAAILQSDNTISTLEASDVGILRIGEIRNPYFLDDRDQFEAVSSFDFVLTHNQTIISSQPIITKVNFEIDRV